MPKTRLLLPLFIVFICVAAGAVFLQRAAAAPPAAAPASGSQAVPCSGGMAGAFPCRNVDLLAFIPISALGGITGTLAANLWGWTDPQTGHEYALVGLSGSTAIVDVSIPEAPVYLGSLPTHTTASNFRDIKIYQDYAYISADAPSLHGLQIFDLTSLRQVTTPPVVFAETAYYNNNGQLGDVHNSFINEQTGFAYLARRTALPELCPQGLYMLDLQNPTAPVYAGCYSDGGAASDTQCVVYTGPDLDHQGAEVCLVASDNDVLVADVSDKAAPVTLAVLTYANWWRAHHVWMTPNQRYFILADMEDEHHYGFNSRLRVWDISDLDAPEYLGYYTGPTEANDHNVWIAGRFAFVGNFRAGLRILDLQNISRPESLREAAFFDLYPPDNAFTHLEGAWAVYPFFQSGTLAVTDKATGLYLLRADLPHEQIFLPAVVK